MGHPGEGSVHHRHLGMCGFAVEGGVAGEPSFERFPPMAGRVDGVDDGQDLVLPQCDLRSHRTVGVPGYPITHPLGGPVVERQCGDLGVEVLADGGQVIVGERVAVIDPQRIRGVHLGSRCGIPSVDRVRQRSVVGVGQRAGFQHGVQLRAGRASGASCGDGQRHPHRGGGVVHRAVVAAIGRHRQKCRCGAVGERRDGGDRRSRGGRGLRLDHVPNQRSAVAGCPPYAADGGEDDGPRKDGGDAPSASWSQAAARKDAAHDRLLRLTGPCLIARALAFRVSWPFPYAGRP